MCTAKRVLTIVIALSVFCSQLLHFFLDPSLPARPRSPQLRRKFCRPLRFPTYLSPSVMQKFPSPKRVARISRTCFNHQTRESVDTPLCSSSDIFVAWCPNTETALLFYLSFTSGPTSYFSLSFFCDVSRRRFVLGYGRFGTDNRSRFERRRLAREVAYQLPISTAWRLRRCGASKLRREPQILLNFAFFRTLHFGALA